MKVKTIVKGDERAFDCAVNQFLERLDAEQIKYGVAFNMRYWQADNVGGGEYVAFISYAKEPTYT